MDGPPGREDQNDPKPQRSRGASLLFWGVLIVGLLIVATILRAVVVQSYLIPSSSMSPTLIDGDRVVVNRLSYQFGDVQRGQVVVFDRPANLEGDNDVIKRIIGLPGETIRFGDGQVYVGAARVVEPYLLEPDSTTQRGVIPGCDQQRRSATTCVVPAGHVFVMGDNRTGSVDSRNYGPIAIDSIVGRATMTTWPLNKIGRL